MSTLAAVRRRIERSQPPEGLVPFSERPKRIPAPPPPPHKTDAPPSAELKYDVQGLREGQNVYGSGKITWQNLGGRYRVDGSAAQPNGMVLRPGGDLLYVTGWSKQERTVGASFGFLTVAYDTSNGSPVWSGGSSSASGSDDLAWSVDLAPDGRRLYVAGYTGGVTAGYRLEGHLSDPSEVYTRDHEPRRRKELLAAWFGPRSGRWFRTPERTK